MCTTSSTFMIIVALNHQLWKVDAKKYNFEEQMKDVGEALWKLRLEYEACCHSEAEVKSVTELVLRNEKEARTDLLVAPG